MIWKEGSIIPSKNVFPMWKYMIIVFAEDWGYQSYQHLGPNPIKASSADAAAMQTQGKGENIPLT